MCVCVCVCVCVLASMLTDVPRHDGRVIKLHYKGQGEIKKILYFVGKVMDNLCT